MPETNIKTEKESEEIKMDLKSKILFAVIALLIAGSVAVTFWRYMVKADYIVQTQVDCDPETENCFIWECDPLSLEEGEACTGVPDEDIWYYKIIRRNAKNIPLCDPEDEGCLALVCPPGEPECEEILCAPETVTEEEECSDPEQYLLENPPEEEEEGEEVSECAPDNEECLDEEEIECEEGDEECLAAQEEKAEECAPDDEECLAGEENEDEVIDDTTEEETEFENAEYEYMPTPALPGTEPL